MSAPLLSILYARAEQMFRGRWFELGEQLSSTFAREIVDFNNKTVMTAAQAAALVAGAPGTPANLWYTGTGVPELAANNGDLYLDTATGNVYQHGPSTWSLLCNIKGPSGSSTAHGVVVIPTGADYVTVTGLGLSLAPTQCVVSIMKQGGKNNLFATCRYDSLSTDGFTADLSAATSDGTYKLVYTMT